MKYNQDWTPIFCKAMATRTTVSRVEPPSRLLPGKSPQGQLNVCNVLNISDLKYGDDLFTYTRGRFVQNEKYEMSQRHVSFNVNELARIAAEAIGSSICVSVEKYPDGMYNKAMLLTMEDGTQVVAKVPNPNAGKPHFTTASEVATMDFVGFINI